MAQEDKITENLEDFKDFDDDESTNELPELEEDLIDEKELMEQYETDSSIFHEKPNKEKEEEISEVETTIENETNIEEESKETEKEEEISHWEELDENNSVVKKYIVYISKDFVPYIDNLTTDERSAYINDAIQTKIDLEDEQKQKEKKAKIISHFIVMALTFCFMTPIVLFCAHKAIMATFDNYKYSQENFEKLYKQRFSKNKAYMRSVQYNQEIKNKTENNN